HLLEQEKAMKTTMPSKQAKGDARAYVENAYDELQAKAGDLNRSARNSSQQVQALAKEHAEAVRDQSLALSRQTVAAIKQRPWTALVAVLLVGAVAGLLLRRH